MGAFWSWCLCTAGRATRRAVPVPGRHHAIPWGSGGGGSSSFLVVVQRSGAASLGEAALVGMPGGMSPAAVENIATCVAGLGGGAALSRVGVLVLRLCLLENAPEAVLLTVGWEGPLVCWAGAGLVGRGWWCCFLGGLGGRLLWPSGEVLAQVHSWLVVGPLKLVGLGMIRVMKVVESVVVVLVLCVVVVVSVCIQDRLAPWWHTDWVHVYHVQPKRLRGREDS